LDLKKGNCNATTKKREKSDFFPFETGSGDRGIEDQRLGAWN
jgi:hypothetical protein